MMQRFLPVVLLALALLPACGGKLPQTRYYTIETGLPALPQQSGALPFDVAVARFRASQILAQDRIVYRPAPHQVDYYQYHRWADAPPDLLTHALLQQLRRAGLFRSVSTMQSAPKADYVLRGRIDHLEEVNNSDSVTVRVYLALEALDTKTHAVVWTGKGSYENQVTDRSVEGVVQQLNEGVRQSLDELTRGLTAFFQTVKPAKQ